MNEREQFLVHCGLTCFGGSEKRQCACPHPLKCELKEHPKFATYRSEAERRMFRHMSSSPPIKS